MGALLNFLSYRSSWQTEQKSLQGALEEKKADPRSFKDDSLLLQPKRDVRKYPQGLVCGNIDSKTTALTLTEMCLQRFKAMDD